MATRRSFSKRATRQTTIKLSPKEAEEIINAEFNDDNKGKHRLKFIFKPHSPNKGDMTLDYNTNKDNK